MALWAMNVCGGILDIEEPTVDLSSLLNREFRLSVVVVGFIGTLMPWYVDSYYGVLVSFNLLDGLVNPDNLGLEVASLLFYLGIACCAMRYVRWSVFGEICMLSGVVIGYLSARDFSIGAGQYIDWIVMIVVGVVIYARIKTY